jgi:hypothetical protein
VAPDPNYWSKLFDKLASIQWEGFSNEELASIKAPILILLGDYDFVRLEHAVAPQAHPLRRARRYPVRQPLRPIFGTGEGDPNS